MTVELKIGRGWRIWINGIGPGQEWEISEAVKIGGDHSETYWKHETTLRGKALPIGDHRMKWIAFDTPDCDWTTDIDGTRLGPIEAFIEFEGADPVRFEVVECWYLSDHDGGAPKGVKIVNGEWIEIDETQAYIRLEEAK